MTNGIRIQSVGALSVAAIVIFILLVILLIPLVFLGIIGAAFTRLGFSWISALAVILLILAGSAVNIPVYTIKRDVIQVSRADPFASWPADDIWDTVVSVNLGGAVIPVCIAVYVLLTALPIANASLAVPVAMCIAGVAVMTFVSTQAIPGAGLQVPLLIPSLAALLIGLAVAGSTGLVASVTAMAGGIFGVLLGGNLAQLGRIRDLGVPSVSIGGSGTFGAILFCCVLPALVA